jgi:predicted DNA-binding transcriptional regulator AlpA
MLKLPATRELLEYSDLAALGIRYSRTQIWRKTKDGTFPAPVKLGANLTAWRREDIDRWIANLSTTERKSKTPKPKTKRRASSW